MIVTAEERTAYFLSKLEAMWPNRLALSVKETAQTLHEMLGVKLGTGAEELVRRAIKSGRLIPGLGRPAGRHWRVPLYDLAYHFGHGFQPADLATTSKLAAARRITGATVPASRPVAARGHRSKAAIVPSTGFMTADGIYMMHGENGNEVWQWAPDLVMPPLPALATEAQQRRFTRNRERTEQIWDEVNHALQEIRAQGRAERIASFPEPTGLRKSPVKSRA